MDVLDALENLENENDSFEDAEAMTAAEALQKLEQVRQLNFEFKWIFAMKAYKFYIKLEKDLLINRDHGLSVADPGFDLMGGGLFLLK